MNTVISIINLVVAIVSAYFALGYYKVRVKVAAERISGSEIELSEVMGLGKTILFGVLIVFLEAGFASASLIVTTVVLAVVLVAGIISIVRSDNAGEARLTAVFFGWLGAPLSVGVVASVVKKFQQFGWDFGASWKSLFFLLAPFVFYIALAVAQAITSKDEETEDSEGGIGIVKALIASTAGLAAVCLGLALCSQYLSERVIPEEQIASEEPAAVETEEVTVVEGELEEDLGPSPAEQNAAEAFNAMLLTADIPADQKAIYDAGMAVGQLDETDYEGTAFEYALTTDPVQLQFLREIAGRKLSDYEGNDIKTEIYPRYDSFPANLETKSMTDEKEGKDYVYLRKNGGIIAGLTEDPNSWATARAFQSKGDDEESFWEGFIEALKNYVWTLQFADSFKEVTVLGVKNQEICDVFDRIVAIGNRNQESGDGIFGVLENIGTEENPKYKYTEEWVEVLEDLYLYTIQWSYIGTHEWWTAERGFLGPSDGSVPDREYKFDYRSIADIRSNFTVKDDRQTNLPSEILCITDKQHGYRLSDYIGINRTDSDVERYLEAPKARKADLDKAKDGGELTVVDYTIPAKQQPSGSTKVTYTASTGEVKKVPTPTPTPRKKAKKDPSKDPSVQNPQNVVQESGINDDLGPWVYVPGLPPVSAATVAEAQGGNISDYTAGIEAGVWEPSGETNNYTPSAGTVVQNATIVDETGTEHTGTETWKQDESTGATVADGDYTETTSTGETEEVHIDHAEAKTEEAHDVDTTDHEKAGSEKSNTSSWDGGEDF